MVWYAIKRVLLAAVTVFLVAAITFFAMHFIPGGPFDTEKAIDPAAKAALITRFHLDRSVPEQFLLYLGNALRGDFGISLKTGRDVSEMVFGAFGVSARLGGLSLLVSLPLGAALGCLAAARRGRAADRAVLLFATLLAATPGFVVATLLLLVFCLKLGWFGVWSAQGGGMFLPVVSLALYPAAYVARLTRASMLQALSAPPVRALRARGVREGAVLFRHALKNAAPPVVACVGPMAAYALTGSMVVETVFTIGGLGSRFVESIGNRDYPVIMAATIVMAALIALFSLLSDLLCRALDPRVEFS
ncbi:MAG TPA: ABC transporter permease [Candidatus Pullichristensenella stercoripullorum]|nr:ABC transporter permease [Candidatus Pullichristensenella stercoripullorum]